jgi:hypothetical protein
MKTLEAVDPVVKNWPLLSGKLARQLVKKYGLPHEATSSMLLWRFNDPWKRTIVWRDGVYHNFPRSHQDLLEQTVDYDVPLEKVQPLLAFNGSLSVVRTKGELTICCRNEAMNFLTINLAHEIIIGRLTPEEARLRQQAMIEGIRHNWPDPAIQGLTFATVRSGYGTGESDASLPTIPRLFQKHRH